MILLSLNRTNERSNDVVEGVEYLRQLLTAPQFAPSRSANAVNAQTSPLHQSCTTIISMSQPLPGNVYFGTGRSFKDIQISSLSKTVAEPRPDG